MFIDFAANHYSALQRSALYWFMNTSNFTFRSVVGAKNLIDGKESINIRSLRDYRLLGGMLSLREGCGSE
jgi:hypothetical protein